MLDQKYLKAFEDIKKQVIEGAQKMPELPTLVILGNSSKDETHIYCADMGLPDQFQVFIQIQAVKQEADFVVTATEGAMLFCDDIPTDEEAAKFVQEAIEKYGDVSKHPDMVQGILIHLETLDGKKHIEGAALAPDRKTLDWKVMPEDSESFGPNVFLLRRDPALYAEIEREAQAQAGQRTDH